MAIRLSYLRLPHSPISARSSRNCCPARVVKAFNHQPIAAPGEPLGASRSERSVLFIAGDDPDAKRLVARPIGDTGGEPMDTGSLREGGRVQGAGGPLAGHGRLLTLAEARRLFDEVGAAKDD